MGHRACAVLARHDGHVRRPGRLERGVGQPDADAQRTQGAQGMFLTGTLLNVAAVLIGATIGVLAGSRVPERMQRTLTDGLGLFTIAIGIALALRFLTDPALPVGDDLAVLGALLAGGAVGELLRLSD